MTSRAILNGWPLGAGSFSSFGPLPPPPTGLYALATKDGSVGQVYSAPSSMTNRQWYRETLAAPTTRTAIAGATGATRTATTDDIGYRLVVSGIVNGYQIDAKALHVVYDVPILLEGFESTTGMTATANATLSVEATDAVQGTNRLVVQGNGTANPGFDKTNIGTFDPSTFGVVAELIDVGFDPAYTVTGTVKLNFTRSGTSYPSAAYYPLSNLFVTPSPLFYGKMWLSRHVSEFTGLSSIGSGQLGISQQTGTSANQNAWTRVGVDALLARAGGRPTIIFGFDDMLESQYTVAFPYMRDRGIVGGIHLVANYLDQPGRLSTAMVNEMYAAGWDVYLNTTDDSPLTTKTTLQNALADLAADRAVAQANGWTRGNEFFAYPNGAYQNAPTRPLTSFTSNGSSVITVGSATNIIVGMTLAAGGVPANTTVTAINGTSITVSNNVPTFTSRPCNFVDLNSEFAYTKLPLALKAAGYRMGRTTQQRGSFLSRFGIADRGGILAPGNATSNQTIDALMAMIDTAILRGETLEFYLHAINDSGGINTDPTKFYGLIDYAAGKRDAGSADVITKTQLWLRDGNSGVPL